MRPKILLVDDHSTIRMGLKAFLKVIFAAPDLEESGSCADMMMKLKKARYSHLILDLLLSDGNSLELLPAIRKLYPQVRIMVFSMKPAEVYGRALRQYGIAYYCSKALADGEIIINLRKFFNDEPTTSEWVYNSESNNPFCLLTPRELEVLHHLLKGTRTIDISVALNVKMNTVSTAKSRIFEKTDTSNLRDLIELALMYNMT